MRHLLGAGDLDWNRAERRSDRWGTVKLFEESDPVRDQGISLSTTNIVGRRGSLLALVKKVRPSWTRNEFTRVATPEIGEEIVLGRGTLFIEEDSVGLKPSAEKEENWLSRKNLFKVHSLTVELYFVENRRKV